VTAAYSRDYSQTGLPMKDSKSNKRAADVSVALHECGGDEGDRTPDLGIANAALSQLSYIPLRKNIIASKGGNGQSVLDQSRLLCSTDCFKPGMGREFFHYVLNVIVCGRAADAELIGQFRGCGTRG
jgi:hypothetical protein